MFMLLDNYVENQVMILLLEYNSELEFLLLLFQIVIYQLKNQHYILITLNNQIKYLVCYLNKESLT